MLKLPYLAELVVINLRDTAYNASSPTSYYIHNTILPHLYLLWSVVACVGHHLVIMSHNRINTTTANHYRTQFKFTARKKTTRKKTTRVSCGTLMSAKCATSNIQYTQKFSLSHSIPRVKIQFILNDEGVYGHSISCRLAY